MCTGNCNEPASSAADVPHDTPRVPLTAHAQVPATTPDTHQVNSSTSLQLIGCTFSVQQAAVSCNDPLAQLDMRGTVIRVWRLSYGLMAARAVCVLSCADLCALCGLHWWCVACNTSHHACVVTYHMSCVGVAVWVGPNSTAAQACCSLLVVSRWNALSLLQPVGSPGVASA